jgi:hypothetical protein
LGGHVPVVGNEPMGFGEGVGANEVGIFLFGIAIGIADPT